MAIEYTLGLPGELVWQGVTLDAALRLRTPVARQDTAAAVDWFRLAALHGSYLEHQVFESQWRVASISPPTKGWRWRVRPVSR